MDTVSALEHIKLLRVCHGYSSNGYDDERQTHGIAVTVLVVLVCLQLTEELL